ncbi:MAG: hypothetical protein KDE27_07860 [Planctomycetes bacterium]|nr:hypothetical protein [Planctomycetota bacterium]
MLAALCESAVGPVALGAGGALGAEELWQNAAAIAALLPPPSPGSMTTFSFGHDRAGFAAALLGTWLAGHGAALPESDRRDFVVPLMSRPEHVELLHDTGIRRGIDVPRVLAAPRTGGSVVLPASDPNRVVLEIHTAASDGSMRVARWTASELLAAVDAIVAELELAPGVVVAHGFTPSFLPAVLVGLLAPLRVGGAFVGDPLTSADRLAVAARECGAGVVLGSARQLRGLARLASGALANVELVACDGEPPAAAADVLRLRHDVTVGAALPCEPDVAAECVERLLAVDGIDDAAVVRAAGDGVALIAVVGDENALLSARAAAAATFAEEVELVLRAVPALPPGANDRVPFGDLCAALGRGRDGLRITRELEWRAEPVGDDGVHRFRTRIPARYAFFEGHFATYPVLAGGVQMQELVLPCVRVAAPELGVLQQLEAVKFLARIAPGDEIVVTLRFGPGGRRPQFEIWCGDTRCTAGKLTFAGPDAAENAPE